MQKNTEMLSGLVVGHKSDGRCKYDPQVKQELVRQCMKPGVSVAPIAMQHGINVYLLRTWITKAHRAISKQMVVPKVSAPFTGAANHTQRTRCSVCHLAHESRSGQRRLVDVKKGAN